nr:MAG TPA: hypothetical protein [Caudoviricetes sp.]
MYGLLFKIYIRNIKCYYSHQFALVFFFDPKRRGYINLVFSCNWQYFI